MRRGELPHALVGLEGNTLALVPSRFYHPAILVERQEVNSRQKEVAEMNHRHVQEAKDQPAAGMAKASWLERG